MEFVCIQHQIEANTENDVKGWGCLGPANNILL